MGFEFHAMDTRKEPKGVDFATQKDKLGEENLHRIMMRNIKALNL